MGFLTKDERGLIAQLHHFIEGLQSGQYRLDRWKLDDEAQPQELRIHYFELIEEESDRPPKSPTPPERPKNRGR